MNPKLHAVSDVDGWTLSCLSVHCERSDIAGVRIDMDRDPEIRRLMLLQPKGDTCDELPAKQVIPHHGIPAKQPDP
jgi:hypothetical protein